jgi:type I restriction enzyme S subunit
MMHHLTAFTVQDLAAKDRYALNGGPFGSKLVSSMYVSSGVPVIRGVNLPFDRRFNFDDFVFVTVEKAEELRPNTACPGDIVFTQRGTLGQIGIIPRSSPFDRFVISQSQMKLTVDPTKANAAFIYYYFRQPEVVRQVEALASSSGVPHINLRMLREFVVTLPNLEVQERIASILSTYDDLIENNTRRIAILEEMARRIFEEWFVHFRAPGCEGLPMADSASGPLPQTWTVAPISALAAFQRGRSYRSNELVDQGGRPFIGLKCLEREGGFRSEGMKRINAICKPEHVVKTGDLLMALTDMTQKRLIVGRTALVTDMQGEIGVFSMDLAKIIPHSDAERGFVYSLLRWSDYSDRVKEFANGANVLHLSLEAASSQSVVLPPVHLREKFSSVIESTLALAQTLEMQNRNLRAQRDLLLPKLISGEIDVSAMPAPMKEAAE